MDEMPPGYRFYPTEEELVSFYLHNKLQGISTRPDLDRVIPVLDIYDFNPSDLPQYAGELCHGDPEQWFFFIPRQEKEARGGRPNRLTTTGYWKATGSPGYVYSGDGRIIGLKRTMVFYNGRAPAGRKTQWKMNEYRAIQFQDQAAASSSSATPTLRQEMSLCRVYIRSKCLRAFDRRPSGPPVIGQTSTSTTQQARGTTSTTGGVRDQATTTSTSHYDHHNQNQNQNPTLMTEMITSSPDNNTSSSGGPTSLEADDAAAVDDESLWDWDQLKWFLNEPMN